MKRSLEKLIVVAGHAAFKDDIREVPANPERDNYWVLQSFQRGEPPYYIEHIKKGAELAAEDESSLLLFSGGRTRKEAGHWSEAATYKAIAERFEYWAKSPQKIMARVALEEFARDSLQNLEFSLYKFYQLTGHYPRYTTVVGWQFKAERFALHRAALNIPKSAFTYVGVNNPEDIQDALKGEQRALEQFRSDPTGSHSPLVDKRNERNPFDESSPYDGCPLISINI